MITTIINNSITDQWTHNYVENFNIQFNSNNIQNDKQESYDSLLEKIFYISPYIFDLYQTREISINTAKLKAKNLYDTFTKKQKNTVAKRLLRLKINKSFNMNKLDSFNPVF